MIRVIIFVLVLALAVAGAVWFANDPGEVTVVWRGWRMDTSVAILLVLIVALVLIVQGLSKFIAAIRGSMKAIAAARRERRVAQGLNALGHGLAAVHTGNAKAAHKYANLAATLLEDNAATKMLAAHAAALNQDTTALRTMAQHLLANPETELAALRKLAETAASEGDVVGAVNHARQAMSRKDAPRWALEIVLNTHIAASRWSEALAALDTKTGREQYPGEEHRRLKAELLTRAAEDALGHGDADAAENLGRRAIDAGGDARAVIAHSKALILRSRPKKAAAEIEKAWAQNPDASLLRAYRAAVPGETALAFAQRIEKLIAENPEHPESRLASAEASLAAQLWGQARSRLSPLLGDEVPRNIQARAAMLMAELESSERNDAETGAMWLKRAVEKMDTAAPGGRQARTVADLLAVNRG